MISIEFPKDGKLRSRDVVSRSNSRSTGKYPSWKKTRMLEYESQHELHAFLLLDACPAVLSFNEQPCVVHYEINGITHRHYPDILVETASGKELWEVKEESDARDPVVATRSEFLQKLLPSKGYTYRVILAEQLSLEPLLENVRKLIRFGHNSVPLHIRERYRRKFQQQELSYWGELVSGSQEERQYVSRLVLEGFLEIDMSILLSESSVVMMRQTKEQGIWPSLLT